ncbi:MAG: N-(5-phosphoribosyl)anthranilate isomerase [Phycisphaerales bacterium]|nr:N-(5-phosphoribosyl)anthranilate isomerase [Phycisphaerales bacterium]
MPRLRVKYCGIMSVTDALAAADAGADAVGMILHANARRQIDVTTAAAIVVVLPPYVTPVGLFVDAPAATVLSIASSVGINMVQFHGNEKPKDVGEIKTLRVIKALKVDARIEETLGEWREAYAAGTISNLIGLLLDGASGGGTGEANDFGRIHDLQRRGLLTGLPPIIIAGGLTPENIASVVQLLRPFAVDTSSGIEAEYGKKSPQKMNAFFDAARSA